MSFEIPEELKNAPYIKLAVTNDRFVQLLGAKIEELGFGHAKVSLVVEDKHLNGVGIVQGGALFTLADYAFALASNTYERTAVGIESHISFMKPTRTGNTLFATAKELSRSKSLGSYSVQITDEKGDDIALFYGRAFFRNPEREQS